MDIIKNIAIDIKSAQAAFVKLYLKKAKIQEAAKDYIQKHLGGINYWDQQNVTRTKLKSIHTK